MRRILILLFLIMPLAVSNVYANNNYEDYAEKLAKLGVFKGTNRGFELDREPTRVEAAIMFVRLQGAEKEAQEKKYEHPFTDVPDWADDYVGYLYHEGLTNGRSATTYGSNENISATSYMTFILRALGYDDSAGDFQWNHSLEFAMDNLLIKDSDYAELISNTFLRDHIAKYSYLSLNMSLNNSNITLIQKLVGSNAISIDIAKNIGVYNQVYLDATEKVDWNSYEILSLAESITEGLDSEYDKSSAIYEWICDNITYESYYEYAVNNQPWQHLTYASNVAKSRKTNCLGFTNLNAALHRALGLEARVVNGWSYHPDYPNTWMTVEESRHAWNEVLIDENWIVQDATMDRGRTIKKYFNPSDEDFNKDHFRDGVAY